VRATPLQVAVALGGAALGLLGVAGALVGEGPAPGWVLRLFAAWCVATPYWWYLEHRWLRPSSPAARREFAARQACSRMVWLGFALAMAVPILARGR
jgi:hypothetical protein